MSSSSVDGVCAMLNHSCTILEQDFLEVLYSRLRSGFPSGFDFSQAYNLVQSSIQQGKLQTQSTDTEKAKATFLVTLNNAAVTSEFIQTLKKNLEVNWYSRYLWHLQSNKLLFSAKFSCVHVEYTAKIAKLTSGACNILRRPRTAIYIQELPSTYNWPG